MKKRKKIKNPFQGENMYNSVILDGDRNKSSTQSFDDKKWKMRKQKISSFNQNTTKTGYG